MTKEVIKKYGDRVKYSEKELETFHEGGHRTSENGGRSCRACLTSIRIGGNLVPCLDQDV